MLVVDGTKLGNMLYELDYPEALLQSLRGTSLDMRDMQWIAIVTLLLDKRPVSDLSVLFRIEDFLRKLNY